MRKAKPWLTAKCQILRLAYFYTSRSDSLMMFPKLVARASLDRARETGRGLEFEDMLPLMRELSHVYGLHDEAEIVRLSIQVMNEACAIVERYLDMRDRRLFAVRRPDASDPNRLH